MESTAYWNEKPLVYNSPMAFPQPTTKHCSRCGKSFQCGTAEVNGNCWCSFYPVLKVRTGADCMCPDCLLKATLLQEPEEKRK